MQCGGIVLAGGKSRRMGIDKASLCFGAEAMLARVVRLVGQSVQPVVVVSAAGQSLPSLPPGTLFAQDRWPGAGPLAGLHAGLDALASVGCGWAFACGCDAPLLAPGIIERLLSLASGFDVVIPLWGGEPQPLLAVYSTRLAKEAERLLSNSVPGAGPATNRTRPNEAVRPSVVGTAVQGSLGRRHAGPIDLARACRTRFIPADTLRDVDAALVSFRGVNTPEDYRDALAIAGLAADQPNG